ncbi:MAG: O-antigen ligase family protein [Candidatus Staskawiczbacteria bacterium]|nr:O-antigen ligase family protein [Candidatus Staskawiczbacteria bacterium]
MKINNKNSILRYAYFSGFVLILLLPLLDLPPWFFPVDWGKTIIFRIVLSAIIFLFIYQLFYKKSELELPGIKKNKIIWALSIFLFFLLLATLFSQDITFSLWGSPYRSGGAVNLVFYIAFGFLSFLLFKKPGEWKKFWDISIIAGVLVCIIAIIQLYGLLNNVFTSVAGRPASTMGNPIILGIYLILLLFITSASAIREKTRNKKIFYVFALLLFLYTILMTGSRAAYLAVLIGALYFILFYPATKNKKLLFLKIALLISIIVGTGIVYYVNTLKQPPDFVQNNRLLISVYYRLSIKEALNDPRFSAWQVVIREIKEKPVLGWGPENLAIGFDKHYDPSLPYISKEWGGWWDRAHNIILDTAASTGIPSAIAYLALLITLFWQLQKLKNSQQLIIHGLQSTLIAYFVANFFGFDTFSTYILFFLIIGYSLHLTTQNNSVNETQKRAEQKKIWWKSALMFALLFLLVIFLWQDNIKPFQINSKINVAGDLVAVGNCDFAFQIMDSSLKDHSFLDAYSRMEYIDFTKSCLAVHPEKNLEYAKRGVEIMKEVTKIRPLYSRVWIYLGGFDTAIAALEKDENAKKSLLEDADSYFVEAYKLAPEHQEILIEQGKEYLVSENYQAMEQNGEKCVALDQSLNDCYWIRGIAEIYLKKFDKSQEDVTTAIDKTAGFSNVAPSFLQMVINGYINIKNYEGMAKTLHQFIMVKPRNIEFHSYLAMLYGQLNRPREATIEAIKVLYISPESKDNVNNFLSQLGYTLEMPTDSNYHLALAKKYYNEVSGYEKYIGEALIAFYISPSNNDAKKFLNDSYQY